MRRCFISLTLHYFSLRFSFSLFIMPRYDAATFRCAAIYFAKITMILPRCAVDICHALFTPLMPLYEMRRRYAYILSYATISF